MKKDVMEQWVSLLRSGEFRQTTTYLENRQGNCCLGVLCNLALVNGICDNTLLDDELQINFFDENSGGLPNSVMEWSGIQNVLAYISSLGRSLATLNDMDKLDFNQIADIIEKYYKEL